MMNSLPKQWHADRLKDVAFINREALGARTRPDYEFRYLEISNVDYYGVIDPRAVSWVRFADAPSRARRRVPDGATVISSVRPNLQAIAHIPSTGDSLICSTGFNVVEPQNGVLTDRFLYYVLISENSKQYLESTATGVGYPAVGDKAFGALQVALPRRHDQALIARFLDASCDSIDDAVEAKRAQQLVLDEVGQTAIYQSVINGLDTAAPTKPSRSDWRNDVPAHWSEAQIKRRCRLVRGRFTHRPRNDPALYGGEHPFIQTGNVARADKYVTTHSQTLNETGLAASAKFPRGTLVMTIAANIGDVAILDFDACFPDSMIGIYPDHRTSPDYLYYLFRAMRPVLLRSAVLTTQLNLNYVRIGMIHAAWPERREQEEIVEYLESRLSEIRGVKDVLQKQIDTLTALRRSLIHECVTGLRRVTEADLNRVHHAVDAAS